jgi:hypothetical protein
MKNIFNVDCKLFLFDVFFAKRWYGMELCIKPFVVVLESLFANPPIIMITPLDNSIPKQLRATLCFALLRKIHFFWEKLFLVVH